MIRIAIVIQGTLASVLLSLFAFKVFGGYDIILLYPYIPGDITSEVALLGFISAGYFLSSQLTMAARPAAHIYLTFLDVATSILAFVVVLIFGGIGALIGSYPLDYYTMTALAMFLTITTADGLFNSFISIRYLPRHFQMYGDVPE